MIVYRENSMVDNIERQYDFKELRWLNKEAFKYVIESNESIYPCLIGHKYIGKTIPDRDFSFELIGTVELDLNNEWILRVAYDYQVYVFYSDFMVLSISDPQAYEWIKMRNKTMPKYALKAALDDKQNEFLYIGRTLDLIGTFRKSDNFLYIPLLNNQIFVREFFILCLKPSPTSLKNLCRITIRNSTRRSNASIKKLKMYLPETLVSYLKYPSSLSVGEFLLRNEKLITNDDLYELYIDSDNYLVCQSVATKQILMLSIKHIDTIWLQRNQTIFFYSQEIKLFIACMFWNLAHKYQFKLLTNADMYPQFLFEILNSSNDNKNLIFYNYFHDYDITYTKYFSSS
jgi:hypothetical protein